MLNCPDTIRPNSVGSKIDMNDNYKNDILLTIKKLKKKEYPIKCQYTDNNNNNNTKSTQTSFTR